MIDNVRNFHPVMKGGLSLGMHRSTRDGNRKRTTADQRHEALLMQKWTSPGNCSFPLARSHHRRTTTEMSMELLVTSIDQLVG